MRYELEIITTDRVVVDELIAVAQDVADSGGYARLIRDPSPTRRVNGAGEVYYDPGDEQEYIVYSDEGGR